MAEPVVIGGVGGSGTRVVAQILLAAGHDLGNDLNRELDDLWFNLLFYRPAWVREVMAGSGADACVGLELMRKRAMGDHLLSRREAAFIGRAWRDAADAGYFGGRTRLRRARVSATWSARRIARFLRSNRRADTADRPWGWKEPISHLVAEDVLRFFPDARYVHVIRHGLDMAFSGNRRQVRRFGPVVGVDVGPGRPSPQDVLHYWIRANRRILDGVCVGVPERTHVVEFERLCRAPQTEIRRLADHLDMNLDGAELRALSDVPREPASVDRYRSQDLSIFDPADLEDVARLGFSV